MEKQRNIRLTRSSTTCKQTSSSGPDEMAELQSTNDIQPSIQGESVNQHILDEILQKLDNLSSIPQQIGDMNKSLSSDIWVIPCQINQYSGKLKS